jgi:hypothetical protein
VYAIALSVHPFTGPRDHEKVCRYRWAVTTPNKSGLDSKSMGVVGLFLLAFTIPFSPMGKNNLHRPYQSHPPNRVCGPPDSQQDRAGLLGRKHRRVIPTDDQDHEGPCGVSQTCSFSILQG